MSSVRAFATPAELAAVEARLVELAALVGRLDEAHAERLGRRLDDERRGRRELVELVASLGDRLVQAELELGRLRDRVVELEHRQRQP